MDSNSITTSAIIDDDFTEQSLKGVSSLLGEKTGFALQTTNFQSAGLSSSIEPTIQNVVATANMQCKLDLKQIALKARNAEYNPKRFAAVIMRIREPKTTALIFSSGKMVVTGAKDETQARNATRKFTRIIQKIDFPAKFSEFKIQNLVASVDVKFPIRLEGLAIKHFNFSSYEPEVFPGLIYRMMTPKVALLIFVSGKLVLTGAKTRGDIKEAFDKIYPVLKEFQKDKDLITTRI
ncbi:unnamed protein product [Blepharisma stoltei]|uniref:TATA-box-binding protein n=1 Tax=Blepharisma stoltei TaxID=1481888 RepID=A0AAU9JMA0_9CILI|nr:unnamed protein product [Blepharisma stoltei]